MSDAERARTDPQVVENELRNLVDEAHARNIHVIFDIVLHHVGDVFAYPAVGLIAPGIYELLRITWHTEEWQLKCCLVKKFPQQTFPNLMVAIWPLELEGNLFE